MYQAGGPVTGLYARMRHPQYVAFIAIMFGFLLQWPMLVMFPVLIFMYVRLSLGEKLAEMEFSGAYRR